MADKELLPNEPCCGNCDHYRLQTRDVDGTSYGSCAMDAQLLVASDLYCPHWHGDPSPYLAMLGVDGSPAPSQDESVVRAITYRVAMPEEQQFALERTRRALPTLTREQLEELAYSQTERAAEFEAVTHWLMNQPAIQSVLAAGLDEPEESDPDAA